VRQIKTKLFDGLGNGFFLSAFGIWNFGWFLRQ
jgi:hypothetical protein